MTERKVIDRENSISANLPIMTEQIKNINKLCFMIYNLKNIIVS